MMNNLFSYEKLDKPSNCDLNEEIKLVANLGSVYVNKKEILKMGKEDVLILDTKVGGALKVTHNNENKFSGIMCISHNKNAIFVRKIY